MVCKKILSNRGALESFALYLRCAANRFSPNCQKIATECSSFWSGLRMGSSYDDNTALDDSDNFGIRTGLIDALPAANARASSRAHSSGVVADLISPDSESRHSTVIIAPPFGIVAWPNVAAGGAYINTGVSNTVLGTPQLTGTAIEKPYFWLTKRLAAPRPSTLPWHAAGEVNKMHRQANSAATHACREAGI